MATAIPTLAGQAAIAAAIADDTPLDLQSMVIGDGNGNPVTVIETMTALVHLRATIGLQTIERTGNRVRIEAIVDENTGGWTIREFGILDGAGTLLFVCSVAPTDKKTLADGVFDVLTLGLEIVVSDEATVTIAMTGNTWATQEYVDAQLASLRTNIGHPIQPYFMPVHEMGRNAPPDSPGVGSTYVIGTAPSGAWVGKANFIAQWRSVSAGWVYRDAPNMMFVGNIADGKFYLKVEGAWRTAMASVEEHVAGLSALLLANPAGVKAMIDAHFPPDAVGALFNDGTGALSWRALMDIHGLTASGQVVDADELPLYKSTPTLANRKVTAAILKQYIRPTKQPAISTGTGFLEIDLSQLDGEKVYQFFAAIRRMVEAGVWRTGETLTPAIEMRVRTELNANVDVTYFDQSTNVSKHTGTVILPDLLVDQTDLSTCCPFQMNICVYDAPRRVSMDLLIGRTTRVLSVNSAPGVEVRKLRFTFPTTGWAMSNPRLIEP